MERSQTGTNCRAATAAEAIAGLEAANEATDVSALLRGFAGPEVWGRAAYLSMCERTGSAVRLSLQNADATLEANGSIEIQGDYSGENMSIAARFTASSAGTYSCTARLSRVPNFSGNCGFAIDDRMLGDFPIKPEVANYTFFVELDARDHDFRIISHITPFWFYSASIFRVPEVELDPS